jgi:glutaredoxin 3
MDVKIYTTPTCGYCRQAKSFLGQLGVDYTEYDVSRDRSAAEEMVRLTGQMGVPVITVDNEVVIGFDRARLQALLANRGSAKPPRFGLKIADAGKFSNNQVSGAIIGVVSPGALGEKAGLKSGDIVTAINKSSIGSAADMEKALAGLRPGGIVSILFKRNGDTRKSEIVI